MAKKNHDEGTIDILKVNHGKFHVCILGTTPLILNRMSEKARHELLMPKGRKTSAEKAANLKHNPIDEFRASPYTDVREDAPTYLQHLSTAFKKAMMGAALDIPGAKKAQIGRLTWVEGERISIYGVPQMFMSVVRSADMNRTPDIRSRAIVPKWACRLSVSFVQPILREQSVVNLLASAGITQGIGDWRNEKGSGTYGQFTLVDADDAEFNHIMKTGGRDAQVAAMEDFEFYDDETRELYSWFEVESKRRGFKVV